MGYRLQGQKLVRTTEREMLSHGLLPGVIQVPANGQPIVLLADCQTVGGYPKIATVISADLARFAQLKAGQFLHFRAVDAVQAKQALLAREEQWSAWLARMRVLPRSNQ